MVDAAVDILQDTLAEILANGNHFMVLMIVINGNDNQKIYYGYWK